MFKFISFYFFICMTVNHKSSRNYVLEFLESLNKFVCVCRISSLAYPSVQFSSVAQSWLFATPWIAALQASLSITNSLSLLKLMSVESVMPSSHLILCHPLLLLPPIPPSTRVFSNESTLCMRWPKYCLSLVGCKEETNPLGACCFFWLLQYISFSSSFFWLYFIHYILQVKAGGENLINA